MRSEDLDVIELGSVSADTKGGVTGIADSDAGYMNVLGLSDD